MKPNVVFISVVPSPYQRDVFGAIATRGRLTLRVQYLEANAPDSPWPENKLENWESVLPGLTLGRARWRSHFNWGLPRPRSGEIWVVNCAMTAFTTQRIIRVLGRCAPWCFWGEVPSAPRTRLRRWLQARQYAPLHKAKMIVAVGRRAMEAYKAIVPGVPITNQPYTCHLGSFARSANQRTTNTEPMFIFCGQMIARKGIDLLVRAFSELIGQNVPARLELVGREAELPRLLAPLPEHVRDRIHFRGFLPPLDLPQAFARADVFVLPSRHDGWGVVVNQALGARLPVICSDAVGAGYDLIRSGENGEIVPAGDVDALAAAMKKLALSPELRTKYSAAAAVTAERLTPEKAAEFWENLAEKLAGPA